MALNIKAMAQKATTLSELMIDREKGETEDLIKLDKAVTINDCEEIELTNEQGEKEAVWVFTIKEQKSTFYFAGTVLKNIFVSLLEACQGDYTELYSEVQKQGLTVKFKDGKNKKGRQCTMIEVI